MEASEFIFVKVQLCWLHSSHSDNKWLKWSHAMTDFGLLVAIKTTKFVFKLNIFLNSFSLYCPLLKILSTRILFCSKVYRWNDRNNSIFINIDAFCCVCLSCAENRTSWSYFFFLWTETWCHGWFCPWHLRAGKKLKVSKFISVSIITSVTLIIPELNPDCY